MSSQNVAPVTNNTPSDYISFNDGAAHTGAVTNNSSLTATGTYPAVSPGGSATGISVLELGTVLNGNIINNGAINASNAGVNIGEGRTTRTTQFNAGAVLNGSITNSGTITSQVGVWVSGSSVQLSSVTGSIINSAGGQIVYTNVGINEGFATIGGSITNYGTITGTGTAGINVAFGADLGSTGAAGSGNIVNATGATVASSYIGIWVNGNLAGATATIAGSIINEGTITVPNQATHAGIEISAATALGGVTNTGTINGGVGIELFGADNKIASVAGNIDNGTGGQINAVSTNSTSGGIEIFGYKGGGPAIVGGSIVNSGGISATGGTSTNVGILLQGVNLAGGITNSSTISVSGGTVNVGISVAQSGSANFVPPGSSIGGSISNHGSIIAETGILVSGGSTVTGGITNSSNINGSRAAIDLTGEGSATTISQTAGTITGSILLSSLADTLDVTGGAIAGNIVGSGSSDTIDFNPGASNTFTYGSSFSTINQVNVTSGTVVLNGADSATALTVSNAGTLAGTGTITSSIAIANGGTLEPGTPSSAGTNLSVVGSLTLASGADFLETIDGASASEVIVSSATLGGATVTVAAGSTVTAGTTYTILDDTGGAPSGTFNPTVTYNGQIGTLSYVGDDVDLKFGEPAPQVTAGATATFDGGGPMVALDSGLSVTDAASTTLLGATVSISSGFLSGDILNFVNQNGITGSYNSSNGTLTLSGTASVADYQTALESITYGFSPSYGDPTAGGDTSRTISWVVTDSNSNSSIAATSTLDTVHVAPTITATATPSFAQYNPPVTLDAALTLADPDSGGLLAGATVSITAGTFAGDGDVLAATTTGTAITATYDSATETLTLSGSDTLADYQHVLDSVTFTTPSGDPTNHGFNQTRTVAFAVNDGASSNNTASASISLAVLNSSLAAGTTEIMIMDRGSDGSYEIYDMGRNTILAAYPLGQISTAYQVAGLGDFSGNVGEADMLMRNSSGAFQIYDVNNNNITGSVSMGVVGPEWSVAGFADFSGNANETDMLMRDSNNGAFELYDIRNNQLVSASAIGAVGLEWQVAGFGDFSGNANETDMLMRDSNNGAFEIYDISNNQLTSAAAMGAVGLEWQVLGFGDFSGNANETDMLMRDTNNGALEVYDIRNNQLTSASAMGAIGLEWQVAGFADFSGNANETDMLMRDSNNGAFEMYDISNNKIVSATGTGVVGPEWAVNGVASDPPSQMAQALASFAPASGGTTNSSPSTPTLGDPVLFANTGTKPA
jgi:hypothetical protein